MFRVVNCSLQERLRAKGLKAPEHGAPVLSIPGHPVPTLQRWRVSVLCTGLC